MAVSKAQQKAVAKYMQKNYDEIKIRAPKGSKKQIQTAATDNGESVNAYIIKAVNTRLKSEGREELPVKPAQDKKEREE